MPWISHRIAAQVNEHLIEQLGAEEAERQRVATSNIEGTPSIFAVHIKQAFQTVYYDYCIIILTSIYALVIIVQIKDTNE